MFQTLTIENKPDEQVVDLLTNNRIGTPGKSMVYEHRNVQNKLHDIPGPVFANLSIRNNLLGTVCFSKREVFIKGESRLAHYVRYFSFNEKFRSGNTERQNKKRKNSIIRNEIMRLLDGEGLKEEGDILFYAYVDSDNIRSSRLIHEFGFTTASKFSSLLFSRLFPKSYEKVEKATKQEVPKIKDILKSYYNDHQFVSLENLFIYNDYYFIRAEGKIVAGAQANPELWQIIEIPGLKGWLLMNLIPYIPILNRFFKPEFRFISIDGIYCKEGWEKELEKLFSFLLYKYKVNTAIISADTKSRLYSILKGIRLGTTNAFQGEIPFDVVIKSKSKRYLHKDLPFYISSLDVM